MEARVRREAAKAYIDAYIPDNQFRSCDPKFAEQKNKYGKHHQDKSGMRKVIPASEFSFDVSFLLICNFEVQLETVDRNCGIATHEADSHSIATYTVVNNKMVLLKQECFEVVEEGMRIR